MAGEICRIVAVANLTNIKAGTDHRGLPSEGDAGAKNRASIGFNGS
jgi:hypothetical protein